MAELILLRRGNSGNGLLHAKSYSTLPTNAREGTIALVTDEIWDIVHISSTRSPTHPTVSTTYYAWINPDIAKKSITLDRKEVSITVGLSGAYISDGENWLPVETYVYENGEWKFLWSSQLITQGEERINTHDEFLGGWTTLGKKAASGSTAKAYEPIVTRSLGQSMEDGSVVLEPSLIVSTGTSTDEGGAGMFYTTNAIDLTPYKTIVFEGTFTRNGTVQRNFALCAWKSIGTYYTSNLAAYKYLPSTSGTRIELDVSGLNEPCYIGLGLTISEAKIIKAYLIPKEV